MQKSYLISFKMNFLWHLRGFVKLCATEETIKGFLLIIDLAFCRHLICQMTFLSIFFKFFISSEFCGSFEIIIGYGHAGAWILFKNDGGSSHLFNRIDGFL